MGLAFAICFWLGLSFFTVLFAQTPSGNQLLSNPVFQENYGESFDASGRLLRKLYFKEKLGRPRRIVDSSKVAALRESGASWRAISRQTGVGVATLYRLCEY